MADAPEGLPNATGPDLPPEPDSSITARLKRLLIGRPRDLEDPHLFHQMSLIALLAWVGLGADGLSSSAYGPDEAFRALHEHTYLSVFLALATAGTVFVISRAYKLLIEHFPFGGGYVVATKLLGPGAGIVSGSALLVDYALTIATSIAGGGDALFSFLPLSFQPVKFYVEVAAILFLILMNLRGVKESVTVLIPVFGTFVITHIFIILYGIAVNFGQIPHLAESTLAGIRQGISTIGAWGLFVIFLKAYCMGGGTYTGIEAVSNGVNIMREPKVATAQRTMTYMAVSLAFTAGGLLFCYMLAGVHPLPGQTMNAVLVEELTGKFHPGGLPLGHWFAIVTLVSETLLLFVAAQTGLIDGPRVMANMALDNWLPRRFASLSDRLTMQDGVLLMGGASLFALWKTGGDITSLLVMYSINVFITFSLTEIAMCRFWFTHREEPDRRRNLSVHGTGLVLCLCILVVTVLEKFAEGGWLTLAMTGGLIAVCVAIRKHYAGVSEGFRTLQDILQVLPSNPAKEVPPLDPKKPTAILLTGGYSGLGVHSLLTIFKSFPGHFANVHFITVGVLDSGNFKGREEIENLRKSCDAALSRYVTLANRLGHPASYTFDVGTDVVAEAERLCREATAKYPKSIVFAGKLVFEHEGWYQRLLHNETANEIQRRLQFTGQTMVILPVRVMPARKPDGQVTPAL